MFAEITPLILTYNEAPNLRRTLEKLAWAQAILVVDSFSTDGTLDILKSFPKVRIIQRQFDTHAAQWNYGLEHCGSPWVLALDADYVLSEELIQELEEMEPSSEVMAYFAKFMYCIHGRPLRGTLYPPRAVLFRKDQCHYEQDGHTQRLRVEGNTGWLRGYINHDDRKTLSHWLWAQDRYAQLEAEHLLRSRGQQVEQEAASPESISAFRFPLSAFKKHLPDRIRRKVILAPFVVFFYTLLGKGLILDGWPGWYYVFQRTLAEIILSLRLLERKLKS